MSEITIKDAMDRLRKAFKEDTSYAHSWHCNLAMLCKDAGASHEVSNEAASRFMGLVFDVKTSNDMLNNSE